MYCSKCGKSLNNDDMFCSHCGNQVLESTNINGSTLQKNYYEIGYINNEKQVHMSIKS